MRIVSISAIVPACLVVIALSHAAGAFRDDDFQGAIQNHHENGGLSKMAQPSSSKPSNDMQHPTDHHTGSTTNTVVSNVNVSSISVISNGTHGNVNVDANARNVNSAIQVRSNTKPSAPSSPANGPSPPPSSPDNRSKSSPPSGRNVQDPGRNGGAKPSSSFNSPSDAEEPVSRSSKPDSASSKRDPRDGQASNGRPSGSSSKPSSSTQEGSPVGSVSRSKPSSQITNAKPSSSRQAPDDHSESLPLSSFKNPDTKPDKAASPAIQTNAKPVNMMPAAIQSPSSQTTSSDAGSPNLAKPAGNPSANTTTTTASGPGSKVMTPGAAVPGSNTTSGTPSIVSPGKRIITTVTRKKKAGAAQSTLASSKASYLSPTPPRGKTPMYSPPNTPTKHRPPTGQLYGSAGHPPPSKGSPPLYSKPSSPRGSTVYKSSPRSPTPALYSVTKRAPAPVYSNPKKSTKKSKDYKAPAPKKQSYDGQKSSDSSSADARRLAFSAVALMLTIGLLF